MSDVRLGVDSINSMQPAKRVLMNTGFLYGKMIFSILISLYATRLVLNALGENDFGIFNLVGGVIGMLSFINGAMASATQRYMSFSLGSGDIFKLKSVFSTSVILHFFIGLTIVLLLEIAGLFLFHGALNIPEERISTAKIVFQLMVLSTFFTINAVPYDAEISAHENFLFDAIIGIIESSLKLGIAVTLLYGSFDKLILYGSLTAALTIFVRVTKSVYCYKRYEECRIKPNWKDNIELGRGMMSFAGWNLFGTFCTVARNQGLAIVLNLFFGIVVNAAYAIANQVNSNLVLFSVNLLKSISPQIIKSEGSGDRKRMLRLSMLACKSSFLLLSFLAIPIIIEMPIVLKIWLKSVPDNAVIFCQLMVLLSTILLMTAGLNNAIQSVGKIRTSQTVTGTLIILNLPISILLLKLGLPAYSVLVCSVILECFAGCARVWFTHTIAGLDIREFFKGTVVKSFFSVLAAASLALIPSFFFSESIMRACFTLLISTISLLFFVKYIALNEDEKQKIKEIKQSVFFQFRKLLKIQDND